MRLGRGGNTVALIYKLVDAAALKNTGIKTACYEGRKTQVKTRKNRTC